MGKKPSSSKMPSFFKVLINDCIGSRVRLPPSFVQKYETFLPENAKLRTNSGETWDVKLEEATYDDGEKYLCFARGWSNFVSDLELKMGEFLQFCFNIDESTFYVSVFGTDLCGRDISRKKERSWKFSKELKRHHFHTARMVLPKDFAIGTGIAISRKVNLQDAKGRKWPVTVRMNSRGSYSMSSGWKHFLNGTKLLIGSVVSFEFIPGSDNVVEALLVEDETEN